MFWRIEKIGVVCVGLVLFALCAGAEVSIENVKLRWIESDQFVRISEFFTGKENQGNRILLRSDPNERGGLYFIVRLDRKFRDLDPNLQVEVEFYKTGSAVLQEYTFDLPEIDRSTKRIFIGITDKEAAGKTLPIAWRVCLKSDDLGMIAEHESYLWEMPDSEVE